MEILIQIISDFKYIESVYVEKDALRFVMEVNAENEKRENIKGSLKENGLIFIYKDLMKLYKEGKVEFVFDDEFLHISFYMNHSQSKLLAEKFSLDYEILS